MFNHTTVLLKEAAEGLNIKPDGVYVDCTLGGAGHSEYIVKQLSEKGKLIAFDQDDVALANAKEKLAPYLDRVILIKSNFRYLKEQLMKHGIEEVDGVLVDLGVSSPQLDTPERGFSFQAEGPLDMRMGRTGPTAAELIRDTDEKELADLIFNLGEERFARPIARTLKAQLPQTTQAAVEAIKS